MHRFMRVHGLLATVSFALLASSAAAGGKLVQVGDHEVLVLDGGPREMGKAQGEILGSRVRQTADWLIESLAPALGVPREELARRALALKKQMPAEVREELLGLAEGSGAPLEKLELAHATPIRIEGLQTAAFGPRTVGGKMIHTVSAPLPTDVAPVASILVLRKVGPETASLVVSWPGYLGAIAGINTKGLSVSAFDAAAKTAETNGLPLAMVIPSLLKESETLTHLESKLRSLAPRGEGIAILCDGKIPDARVVEKLGEKEAVFGAGDSAENRAPFKAVPQALRRSALMVDEALGSLQRGGDGDPTGGPWKAGLAAYERFATSLESSRETVTIADSIRWIREGSKDAHYAVVLSPSDPSLWLAAAKSASGVADADFQRLSLFDVLTGRDPSKEITVDTPARPRDPAAERSITGVVEPRPRKHEDDMPEMYRLGTDSFTFELEPEKVVQGVVRSKLRYPSPVKTPYPENNIVHAEYFRPLGPGPFPCVICLHIAGGDFELSRFVANNLSQRGIATVFVKMPYYGERQPPGKKIRMLEPDVGIASEAMRQVILDLRRLCDWIEAWPDLDGDRIGVQGISLGSITGSLACAIEPRISHACLIMGGGSLADIVYESTEKEAREYRKLWSQNGGTRDSLAKLMAPFDPVTYPERLKERVLLMICASQDESVPKKSSMALWEAAGRPELIWYPCGHYTMVRYLMPALGHAVRFYKEWPTENRHTVTSN